MNVGLAERIACIPLELTLRIAISTLIKDFRTNHREETEWAREILEEDEPTEQQIARQAELALFVFCPEVPDRYVPFLIELLTAAIRLAKVERKHGIKPRKRIVRVDKPGDLEVPQKIHLGKVD